MCIARLAKIPTAVDGLHFSAGAGRTRAVMDRGTVIRSQVLPTMGKILHARHQYHWHTGYEPPQTVAAPHMGAWLAKALGPRDPAVPPFIVIGQPYEGNGEAEELKAFETGGFLGERIWPVSRSRSAAGSADRAASGRHEPRAVSPPAPSLSPSAAMPAKQSFRPATCSGPVCCDRSRSANRLLESPAGERIRLVARAERVVRGLRHRPVRAGMFARARLDRGRRGSSKCRANTCHSKVGTITTTAIRGWWSMKQMINAPVARLVRDLEERGLLDRTLIVLASEFSRSMMVEGKSDQPRARASEPAGNDRGAEVLWSTPPLHRCR